MSDSILSRAHELVPSLRERSRDIERARRLPDDVVKDLTTAGLFRLLVPKKYAGEEAHPRVLVEALETIARGDSAAAWCVMTACTTSLMTAYLEEAGVRELLPEGPDVPMAGIFAPKGKAVVKDGGYVVSGRWSFASGCEHSPWRMGGAIVFDDKGPKLLPSGAPDIRFMFFRADETKVIDTWSVSGLRGTGSHDLEVNGIFVPQARTTSIFTDAPRETGPLYKFPIFGLLSLGIAGVALGIGRAAIDAFVALAREKSTGPKGRTIGHQELVQVHVAEAEAELRAARAFVFESIDRAWEAAEKKGTVADAEKASLRLAAAHAARASSRAVDRVYDAAGGTSIYETCPIERHFRDIHVVTQHIMVSPNTYKLAGRLLLGIETDTSQL
ncbi:MAG: acyl-CoA dehydrogenase family protein [Polyangiaceae bacterium]